MVSSLIKTVVSSYSYGGTAPANLVRCEEIETQIGYGLTREQAEEQVNAHYVGLRRPNTVPATLGLSPRAQVHVSRREQGFEWKVHGLANKTVLGKAI